MPAPAPEGENAIPSFTDADLISNVKSVFGETLKASDLMQREDLFASFVNLTGIYVIQTSPQLAREISFDYSAVQSMFARFQRDAYGVASFHDFINQAVTDQEIDPATATRILAQLPKMGIRINTESPKKDEDSGSIFVVDVRFPPRPFEESGLLRHIQTAARFVLRFP
jgi:hypothetical protein